MFEIKQSKWQIATSTLFTSICTSNSVTVTSKSEIQANIPSSYEGILCNNLSQVFVHIFRFFGLIEMSVEGQLKVYCKSIEY